ncbi:hypothetical protein [Paenibacillus abyssi]|uniref:hypothetical protein n=1 Tax=Paenibacillus abyssi TaxID=1340531 RepID=UPI001662D240|nr:hypothetical protein [Paenibacillus abyssi]
MAERFSVGSTRDGSAGVRAKRTVSMIRWSCRSFRLPPVMLADQYEASRSIIAACIFGLSSRIVMSMETMPG